VAAFKNLTNSKNLVVITEIVLIIITIVIVVIFISIIPFRVVNQPEPVVCVFKKQVANSKIGVPVNVNLLIYSRQLFKNNSIWHIYQYITNSPEEPEKVPVVNVVPVVVMNEKPRATCKSSDYMSKFRVMVIMFMKTVRIRMVTVVIRLPAV
jgi:hypothetical protein